MVIVAVELNRRTSFCVTSEATGITEPRTAIELC